MRRVGVLMSTTAEDTEGQARFAAFLQGLRQSGWAVPGNLQIDTRWGSGDADRIRKYAAELLALAPDVILASGGAVAGLLLQATRTVPIVFTLTPDPVGAGFVKSLAHPGGNATGFTSIEYEMSGKWLELMREIAPGVTRVAVLRDPTVPAGIAQFAVLQSAASSLGIELSAIGGRDAPEIEGAVTEFARSSNGGLIVLGSAVTVLHRDLIITLAARTALPAVYPGSYFVSAGGLISYSADSTDPHRRAAGYVDRILRGDKPANLPVQNPIKYELVVNLKTAKSLGLKIPDRLLAIADEVIE
ncbi:MAG: ABC transporter substrate-binding protein [Hyphomicrobiales bacterium]|nr:ABC transporter substrate-binding protein [Hyphomicrobiales bacterium]MBV8241533.1 ABC transporter substrate-binding protein [Hyphomicrobiales bacterium]MBV8322761.1 ABC transporter substrate-binding protein [Hyphomicrobiales bacterium]